VDSDALQWGMTKARTALLSAIFLLCACAEVPKKAAGVVVDHWHEPSVAAARQLMNLYGVPDDVTPNKLVWRAKGPWRRIVVWNRPMVYRSPRDFDLVVQTVKYPVTREQAADLVAFSNALVVDVGNDEISSRGTREEVNFLNLNLADDVLRGRKTVGEAQVAYRRILDLTAAGKSSPYTSELRFQGR
jgi:hypothetical protein